MRSCWLVGVAVFLAVGGCAPDVRSRNGSTAGDADHPRSSGEDGLIEVVATVGMVADLARNVGGERVHVEQLMGAGVDPHLYKATRDDVQALAEADVIFYNGLLLEGKMSDILGKISRTRPAVAVAETIDRSRLLEPPGASGHADPHVWMDVATWSLTIDAVCQALSKLAPEHAAYFEENAAEYRAELERLDAFGRQAIDTIPADRRVLVTSHDAFGYFGRAYGLEVRAVQGMSTDSEAGLRQINQLVELIVTRDIRAVFVESSVSSKNIESLVEGVRARGGSVKIGGELLSDAMGKQGTYPGTYVGMLDHNITTIATALGGDVDPRGMQGKLDPGYESNEDRLR